MMDDGTGAGTCMAGIISGLEYAPYTIGTTFMKTVMVVFDVGSGEMKFTSR